jgi:hypothetical protein
VVDRGGVISRSADTVKPGNIRSDYGSFDLGNASEVGFGSDVRCGSGSDLRLETMEVRAEEQGLPVTWVRDEMG